MAKYLVVDHCPVPEKLYPVLVKLKADTGCVYQSIYRGTDARALLVANGKHDQAWLYANLPPGVANPPGRSTHELKSDGAAYVGPPGRPLFYWQVGMDIDDGHVAPFIRAASKHGYTATITYPTSRVEYHHVNFRKEPLLSLPVLKLGSKGPRVVVMSRRLKFVRTPNHKGRYLKDTHQTFTKTVEDALKKFQADHHQKADGIYGTQTARQLAASTRYWKQQEAKNK